MAEAAAKLQMQIRENSTELNDFLKDLSRWEGDIKNEDKNLQTTRRIEEKLPPVRSTKKKVKLNENKQTTGDTNNNKDAEEKINDDQKPTRIKSYDYDAWSKFDVVSVYVTFSRKEGTSQDVDVKNQEAACRDSSEEDDTEDEEEYEEEDNEEAERIRETQRIHQANLEKEKGNQFFKDGKYEAAINRYTNAISLHSTNPILYANRGMALLKTEKYGAAESDCTTALQYDPTYTKALARRACAREKLKKYTLAIEDYEKVLEYEPKNKQALTEIEKIRKVIAKAEKQEKSKENAAVTTKKSDIEPRSDLNRSPERKRRSNKPLKRIAIVEVGNDDEKEEEEEASRNKQSSRPSSNATTVEDLPPIPTATTVLTVPTTSFMFETELKRLQNNQEELYKYLKLIPLADYPKLFHQCIDGLISPFISTLLNCYKRDNHCYHEELEMLTRVKRFDMATMFLSTMDKKGLQELFSHMKTSTYPNVHTDQQMKDIAHKYAVKL